jgi:hypothetical protein
VNDNIRLLTQGTHFLSAFGAKDRGHVIFVHDGFAGQIDEKEVGALVTAGFIVAVESLTIRVFLGTQRQLFHGLTAPGAEDGSQIVPVHDRFLGQFKHERTLVRVGAAFTVAKKFGRHNGCSLNVISIRIESKPHCFGLQAFVCPRASFRSFGQTGPNSNATDVK